MLTLSVRLFTAANQWELLGAAIHLPQSSVKSCGNSVQKHLTSAWCVQAVLPAVSYQIKLPGRCLNCEAELFCKIFCMALTFQTVLVHLIEMRAQEY